jgi:hypothetical protein
MESEDAAPTFLTSTLDGVDWSASRPCRSNLGETAPGTHFMRGRMGPRAGKDHIRNRIPTPRLSIPWPNLYTD